MHGWHEFDNTYRTGKNFMSDSLDQTQNAIPYYWRQKADDSIILVSRNIRYYTGMQIFAVVPDLPDHCHRDSCPRWPDRA